MIVIIIPAYNEESAITKVLEMIPHNILGHKTISIVIDDGSTDGTYDRSKEVAQYVLRHSFNLGQGSAMLTGFEFAKKLDFDYVVTMDADGQHNPKEIKNLIEPLIKNKADIANGSRMHNPVGMPLFKIFANWLMNIITYLVFFQWTTDSQSGMRAFSKNSLEKIELNSTGHEVCSEIIGEIKRNNLRLMEIPISAKYSNYSKKKGQNWINGINILTRIITIRLSDKK